MSKLALKYNFVTKPIDGLRLAGLRFKRGLGSQLAGKIVRISLENSNPVLSMGKDRSALVRATSLSKSQGIRSIAGALRKANLLDNEKPCILSFANMAPAKVRDVLRKLVRLSDTGELKVLPPLASGNTPVDSSFKLVRTGNGEVARAAIETLREIGIPEEEIMEAAADGFVGGKLVAANSLHTPLPKLKKLVESSLSEVALAAIETLRKVGIPEKEIMEDAAEGYGDAKLVAANSSETPFPKLKELVKLSLSVVALAAIETLRKAGTPEEEIMKIAFCGYTEAKLVAANSKHTPGHLLFHMIDHGSNKVAAAARKNLESRGIDI